MGSVAERKQTQTSASFSELQLASLLLWKNFPNKKSTKAAPLLTKEHPRYQRSGNVVIVTIILIWPREIGKGTRVSLFL